MTILSPELERVRSFLKNDTFLGRLPDVAHDALIAKGHLRGLARGAFVYRRGDPGDSLIVLIKGLVKLTNTNVGGREVVLHYVGVSDIFGEIAALDGKERAADAIALEDSEVFVVFTRDLLPVLIAHPDAMLGVIQALCGKIRAGAAIIEDNTLKLRGRTVRGLLRLARQHGRPSTDGTTLQLTISQEELGKYLGMSRGNVNKQLAQLKIANMIRITGTEISIIDEKALVEVSED